MNQLFLLVFSKGNYYAHIYIYISGNLNYFVQYDTPLFEMVNTNYLKEHTFIIIYKML